MTAALLIEIAWFYTYAGLAVAAVFLTVGIGRVMEDARGAYVFRPLLVPGIVLLWPAVLWRWIALERRATATATPGVSVASGPSGGTAYKPPRRLQDGLAVLLAVLVPLIILVSLLVRQDGPLERAPERLDPPPATQGVAQ